MVSPEERDLALKFLNPVSQEHALLKKENILDLSQLAKPPQVGDYIKDHALLGQYREALRKAVEISDEYEAIIIAGGSGAIPGFMADRGLQSLILAFHKLGKPIMGECNGGLVIAQTIDPDTGKSILAGHAVTTHSWLDEYQSGWGWTAAFSQNTDAFWSNGQFDLKAYQTAETWDTPGTSGNPLIDSEAMFKNAAGDNGVFFSPPGSPYSVVVDENLITCRTTPDGYPGALALLAVMDGRPSLRGRLYIDADERGRTAAVSTRVCARRMDRVLTSGCGARRRPCNNDSLAQRWRRSRHLRSGWLDAADDRCGEGSRRGRRSAPLARDSGSTARQSRYPVSGSGRAADLHGRSVS